MPSVETELKLAVTPRTLARLAIDPLLGAPHGAPRRLVALYFDTGRYSLWRQKLTLRVRGEGRRWLQTIKGGGSVEAGLHRRLELTRPAAGPRPDLRRLGKGELEQRVRQIARRAALQEAFRIEIERDTRITKPAPGVEIEICLDRGAVSRAGARASICELELELRHGPPRALFDLAVALAANYPVRLEHRSKAERGYELIGAVRPAPVRGSLRVVRRGMSAAQAFHAATLSCLEHLQSNLHGVSRGTDPEYLHQARVALRRLRSLIGAFDALLPPGESEPRAKALRRLTRALGPARDWDVFVAATLTPVLEQFPGHRGLAALARASERLRAQANLAARRALAARPAQRLLIELGGWLAAGSWRSNAPPESQRAWDASVREHAAAVLARNHRRVLKRGRRIGAASVERLHRLRIAAKNLRYAANYFAPLYPRARTARVLSALNALQELLGGINDYAGAPALIEQAAAAARGPLRAQARSILTHWNAAMLDERRGALKRAWKTARRREPFWE